MSFQQKFLQHIQLQHLLDHEAKIIIAVSGGADSISLLYALIHIQREFGFSIIIAHYDHHLRPSSIKDRLFVQKTAEKLGLPFLTEINKCSIPSTGSIEEFARDLRYDFLFRMVRKHKADALLTGHTRDDVAETVLMRLIRGTGLTGLQAILPKRRINGVMLIRPMLIFSRQDIEQFLQDIKVSFISDPSNQSIDFTRNKIRHLLLPFLEKEFQTSIKENLARLADTSANDYAFIQEEAEKFLKKFSKNSFKSISIQLAVFKLLHPSLRRMVLRTAYSSLLGTVQPLTMGHINIIDSFVFKDKASKGDKICLPRGLGLKKSALKLVLTLK